MALVKNITYDYEVRTDHRHIHIREKTDILEDGAVLSSSYKRRTLLCDSDVSSESDEVKAMASSLWTDSIKETFFISSNGYPSGDPSDSWTLAQLQKYCDSRRIEHYPEAIAAVEAVEAVEAVAEEVDEDGNVITEAVEAVEGVEGVEAKSKDTKASLLAAIAE